MGGPNRITHPLKPIFDERSRALVLGTIPSPASRTAGFYYGHPQNRFWKVLAALFAEPEPRTIEERTAFLVTHGIALWDVLSSCTIEGASDASIAQPGAQRSVRHHQRCARKDRIHHRRKGVGALPQVQRPAARTATAYRSAVDKSRERPHAPGRPCRGVPSSTERAPPVGGRSALCAGRPTHATSETENVTRRVPYTCRTPLGPPWRAPL